MWGSQCEAILCIRLVKPSAWAHLGDNNGDIKEELPMAFFAARDAETSLVCPRCGVRLHIGRSCHEVHMHCPACKAEFPLNEYISQADEAMERFLENVYCDRV